MIHLMLMIAVAVHVTSADAGTAYFEIDGFSFFYFEGAASGGAVSTARVPIHATQEAIGVWRIEIAPGSFDFPELVYPSGRRVVWRLSAPAVGRLEGSDGTYRCVLSVPAVAFVDGEKSGLPMTFEFTTENASAQAAGVVAARQGSRVDARSGQVQLVAAGVNPNHAATAPGKPFYVVLSGRFTGIAF
jgi:hypothetical protein